MPTPVGRGFLAATYRVTNCQLFGSIKPDRNIPAGKVRHMIFPDHPQNPGLPSVPGAPGTLISNRPDVRRHALLSLWVKSTDPEGKAWMYFGEYEVRRSSQVLSGAEFAGLPEKTKDTWVKALFTTTLECYASMTARIWLHKHGAKATPEAIEDKTNRFVNHAKEQKKAKPKVKVGPGNLTKQDILEGLCAGTAMFDVITLRCVGYDHAFETAVAEAWGKWLQDKGS